MTDTASLEALIGGVVARHGRIDVLVSNAGITRDQLMLRMKRADWDDVLATNLTAAFTLCQAALKPMIQQRSGRIVAISSVVGQIGNAGQANYAASKAGLIGFCKSLAREVASRNVTVNVVAPGLIETDMTRALDRGCAEGLVGADSARTAGHAGRCRRGRVLSRVRRGIVYYRTGSGRQRRHVHVVAVRSPKCGVRRRASSKSVRSAKCASAESVRSPAFAVAAGLQTGRRQSEGLEDIVAVADKVKSIIVEQLGVDEEEVTPDASFVDDLGADSLDTVELVMAFEEEFGIEIPDEDAEKITRVKEAIEYIEAHAKKK